MGDRNNYRAEALESLRGLLAVVEAIPEDDCPRLYVTNSAVGGGWSIQVTKDGNGDEASRRLQVARIAAIAGLTVTEEAPRSINGEGWRQVYTGLDDPSDAEIRRLREENARLRADAASAPQPAGLTGEETAGGPSQAAITAAATEPVDERPSADDELPEPASPADAGTLPSGEPCAYARDYGSDLWHEHDHDVCLDAGADDQDEDTALAGRLAPGGAL